MKQVILVGDSIRQGYEPVVAATLAGAAEVSGPQDNGGDSSNVVAHLDEWVIEPGPDIVHVNAGLHDIKREFGSTERQVPIDLYRQNLETLFRRIQDESDAEIIWATITPVNGAWHHQVKGFDRFEADVLAYNRAALDAAAHFGVTIDDLFQVVVDGGRDKLLSEDGVHFAKAGYAVLGKAVAASIRARLEPKG